jgi:glycosyltransferase involved in cell wall biosynthesis
MKKKILFIDHDHRITGSTVSLKYLLKAFKEEGFEIVMLTPKAENYIKYFENYIDDFVHYGNSKIRTIALDVHFSDDESVFSKIGIKKFCKSCIKFFLGLAVTYTAIKKIKPDLVYVNEYVVLQASIVSRLLNVPSVMHIRSLVLKDKFRFRKKILISAIARFSDLIFAISKIEAQQIVTRQPFAQNKVFEICEFIDENNYNVNFDAIEIKKAFKLPLDKKIVIMVGGVAALKGTLDFVKAAEIVLKERNDVIFLITGHVFDKGPHDVIKYAQDCFSVINSPEVNSSILLMGIVKNIIELLACCDILVSPSTETHFSRPVVEAWALKKAVIATRTAHSENLIEENVDGALVEINNPNQIALCINKILSNREFALTIGENGYKKALKDFGKANGAEKIVKLCSELITGSK